MDTSPALPQIDETLLATTRYLQALTLLDDESAGRPSVLPGWSRGHVVAHLSRNADAFTRVLTQVSAGEPASMYDSNDARDRDIAATVERHDAAGLVADAHEACTPARAGARGVHRRPGDAVHPGAGRRGRRSRCTPSGSVAGRRWRSTTRTSTSATPPTTGRRTSRSRWSSSGRTRWPRCRDGGPSMVLSSTDVPGLWKLGEGQGPEIHGTAGRLAWWLVGRGGGAGLTCSAGDLPVLGRWR